MIYLVSILVAAAVALLVYGAASLSPVERTAYSVRQRLASLPKRSPHFEIVERRRRQKKRERLGTLLEALGERIGEGRVQVSRIRKELLQGGVRHAKAPWIYLALRGVLAVALAFGALLLAVFLRLGLTGQATLAATGALAGWMGPWIWLRVRTRRRRREIRRSLPDALDLMVVCVEAGLGLNQALQRVAEEMDRISPELADELTLTNLEIRAGAPRSEALHMLAERTGLQDVRSLTGMLVQTDRYGTSVAKALRVHADTLRTKRMQEAEEKAAKLSIKMLFPLVFFIFPAIFVVILGPALLHLGEIFGGMG